MNEINLTGTIKNIRYSHSVNGCAFDQADLFVDDTQIINLKFKHHNLKYKDGDIVSLTGCVRSYSIPNASPRKSLIYVLTDFSPPAPDAEKVLLDGRICRTTELHTTQSGSYFYKFTIANNIIVNDTKFNSYIPCVAYGSMAKLLSEFPVSTFLETKGYIKSFITRDNALIHEYVITNFAEVTFVDI